MFGIIVFCVAIKMNHWRWHEFIVYAGVTIFHTHAHIIKISITILGTWLWAAGCSRDKLFIDRLHKGLEILCVGLTILFSAQLLTLPENERQNV